MTYYLEGYIASEKKGDYLGPEIPGDWVCIISGSPVLTVHWDQYDRHALADCLDLRLQEGPKALSKAKLFSV